MDHPPHPDTVAAAARTGRLRLRVGPFVIAYRIGVAGALGPFALLNGGFPRAGTDEPVDAFLACQPRRDLRQPWRRRFEITLDHGSHAGSRDLSNAVPFLEWSANWALAGSGDQFLMIHAGVVARNDRALLLPAPPGSGKSTLCAALAGRGWRLLTDEIALVRPADGQVLPCPRPVSLKNRSIELMRAWAPDRVLPHEFPNTPKGRVSYLIPSAADVAAQDRPATVAAIVVPRRQAGSAPRLVPLGPGEALSHLVNNAINPRLHGEAGFRLLTGLARSRPAFRFDLDDLAAARETLEERLAGHLTPAA